MKTETNIGSVSSSFSNLLPWHRGIHGRWSRRQQAVLRLCFVVNNKKQRKRKRIRNEAYGQSSNEWRRWVWVETPYDKWTNSEERIKKWKRQDMPLGAGLQDRSSSHCMPTNIPAKFSMLPIITLLCVVQYNSWPVYGGFFFLYFVTYAQYAQMYSILFIVVSLLHLFCCALVLLLAWLFEECEREGAREGHRD